MATMVSTVKRIGKCIDIQITIEDDTVEHYFLFVPREVCGFVSMNTAFIEDEFVDGRLMIETEPGVPILDIGFRYIDYEMVVTAYKSIIACVTN
jgi:hypothetical protein